MTESLADVMVAGLGVAGNLGSRNLNIGPGGRLNVTV
jgi:hypothetical protein